MHRKAFVIVSIHHYELADGITINDFEEVIGEAKERRLFDIPGLSNNQFLYGIKVTHRPIYSIVVLH